MVTFICENKLKFNDKLWIIFSYFDDVTTKSILPADWHTKLFEKFKKSIKSIMWAMFALYLSLLLPITFEIHYSHPIPKGLYYWNS